MRVVIPRYDTIPLDGSFDLQVCADTVAEFLFRFWIENEVYFADGSETAPPEITRYETALRLAGSE